MPKAFEACVKAGGKVRRMRLGKGGKRRWMNVCVRPGGKKGPRGGRTVSGEVHTYKRHGG